MFDIGFSEIVVIGAVALVVFGPEELPRVARTAGHLLGKMRRYVADVKSDIAREMELADLKRIQDEMTATAQSLQNAVNEQTQALRDEFNDVVAPVREEVAAVAAELAPQAQDSVADTPQPALALTDEDTAGVAQATAPAGEPALQLVPLALGDDAPAAEATPAEVAADDGQLDLFGMPVAPQAKTEEVKS